jgi:hypothetical protein
MILQVDSSRIRENRQEKQVHQDWARVRIQFRAEAFNVLNHPTSGFGVAGGASLPTLTQESADVGYGDPYFSTLSSRRLQFGLRFLF